MPLYDRKCPSCDWRRDDCYEQREFVHACPSCGVLTERLWARMNIIPDTFTTPLVDDNIARERMVFHSRSERKAAMKKLGLRERFQHVGAHGSDKSKHSIRWT